MRVLFTHSYFLKFDPKQWKQMRPYAPLATIYAAAVLRQDGFEVALHDVMFADGPGSLEDPLDTFRPDMVVVYDDGFNYLTKMCLTNMREAALAMCRMAKRRGCTVVVSSSDATDNFELYLDNGADFVLIGEGEQTLTELAAHLRSGHTDPRDIPGLVFRDDAHITTKTLPRKVIHDLDTLPDPAWDLVAVDQYRDAWMQSTGYFSINMSTTRGCPFKCNWCAKPIYGSRYNVRSPERVVAELQTLQARYEFDNVWFSDDIFGLKSGWIKRFSELIREAGLKFSFRIQSRADLLLNDEQIAPLAAAGCTTVWIGAESGSQAILDAMDKGITVEEIKTATTLLKDHGIEVAWFLQFGYPGETRSDIEKTIEMVHNNMPDDIGISVSYPLPGTAFYENVRGEMKQKKNWTDSDDLALLFRNTFAPVFYRRLHKYVHAGFRKLKARTASASLKKMMALPYYAIKEKWHLVQLNRANR